MGSANTAGNSGVEVRLAGEDDADQLSAMNYEFNGEKISTKYIVDALHTSHEIVAIASLDDGVAGFACGQLYRSFCYDSLCGEISEMYVREAYRRKGVGSALLLFLEKVLRKRGAESIKVLTGQDNGAALGLYASLGYLKEGEVVLGKQLRLLEYH